MIMPEMLRPQPRAESWNDQAGLIKNNKAGEGNPGRLVFQNYIPEKIT